MPGNLRIRRQAKRNLAVRVDDREETAFLKRAGHKRLAKILFRKTSRRITRAYLVKIRLPDISRCRACVQDRLAVLLCHVTAAAVGELQDQGEPKRDQEERDQRGYEKAKCAFGDGDLAQERQRQAEAERALSKEQLPQLRFAQNLSPVPRRPDEFRKSGYFLPRSPPKRINPIDSKLG